MAGIQEQLDIHYNKGEGITITKWMLKQSTVETISYIYGMEDGFSCIPFNVLCRRKDINGKYKQCETCTLDIKKKPFLQNGSRISRVYINHNDLIVIDSDKYIYPCSREKLEEKYNEI